MRRFFSVLVPFIFLFSITSVESSTTFAKSYKFYDNVGEAGSQAAALLATGGTTSEKMNQAATAFLSDLRTKHGLTAESNFYEAKISQIGGHSCRRYNQTFRRQAVLGTGAMICFDRLGTTEETASTICDSDCLGKVEEIQFPVDNVWPFAVAEMRRIFEAMEKRTGKPQKLGFVEPMSIVTTTVWVEEPETGGLLEAYSMSFDTRDPYDRYTVYLDGRDGKMIAYVNRLFKAEGTGQVYYRDPVTTKDLTEQDLHGLAKDYSLENRYFVIKNEDAEKASSPDGTYFFPPQNTHFDEVQGYWGMQFGLERYQAWGLKPKGKTVVTVHYGDKYANAFWDGKQIALGDGDGKELSDLAQDNTIVIHEFGHKNIEDLSPIDSNSYYGEGGALHEGYADYFACAAYNIPSLGDGIMLDPATPFLRRCNLTKEEAPFDMKNGEVHDAGQVWSSAAWEGREAVGSDAMDPIVLQSLHRIKNTGYMGSTTMNDAFRAVLSSAKALLKGKAEQEVVEKLKAIFHARGFDEKKDGGGDDGNPYHKTPGEPLIVDDHP